MESARLGIGLEADGFAVVAGALDSPMITRLVEALSEVVEQIATEERMGIYAIRNVLAEVSAVSELAGSVVIRRLVEPALGTGTRPVRAQLFNRKSGGNWKVPWHQTPTIAVRERREVPGFGPWSVKGGVLHVDAPASVLEQMLAVRLHLDESPREAGALRVIPGSHNFGRLDAAQIQDLAAKQPSTWCDVEAGGALLIRPLAVRAASPAPPPAHRRVIQIDYSAKDLPGGLDWA